MPTNNNVSTSNSTIGAGKYQSANYAYFDEADERLHALQQMGGHFAAASSGIKGQFFPFTDPKAVFTLDSNSALTQASIQLGQSTLGPATISG